MDKKQTEQVARAAAIQAVKSLHGEFGDIVRSQLPIALAETKKETSTRVQYQRAYVEPPAPKVSNYAEAIMASAKWRAKKGPFLGLAWMYKRDRGELLIEQYGTACSVLHRVNDFKRAVFDSAVRMIEPGTSPWGKFYAAEDVLETVIGKLQKEGWSLVDKSPRQKQLKLVPLEGGHHEHDVAMV